MSVQESPSQCRTPPLFGVIALLVLEPVSWDFQKAA
jgi:hypothetical protein